MKFMSDLRTGRDGNMRDQVFDGEVLKGVASLKILQG